MFSSYMQQDESRLFPLSYLGTEILKRRKLSNLTKLPLKYHFSIYFLETDEFNKSDSTTLPLDVVFLK